MTVQTWIVILAFALSKPVTVYAFCEPLAPKYKKRWLFLLYPVGCALLTLFRALLFIYLPEVPDALLYVIAVPLYSFAFFRIACSDKSSKIALITVLIYALGILGHILASFVYLLVFGNSIVIDFVSTESMYAGIIAMLLEILLYSLFFFIWRRYIGRIRADIPNMWAFFLILGGQLVYSLSQLLIVLSQPVDLNPWAAGGIAIMTVGNLALLQILLTNSKKAELEENLRDVQHIRELEKMHYNAMESRRHEMAKIRHDFNNQIVAAHQLIATGKGEHAETLLGELERSISNAGDFEYCRNAIVNAVLSEKQKECDEAGIAFACDVALSDNCTVSPLHLCSIFTNLLDNAIRASKALPAARRRIDVRSAVKGDYLHIKCTNPVAAQLDTDRGEGSGENGYGNIILTDIAGYYSGHFTAERVGTEYVAVLSLLCEAA